MTRPCKLPILIAASSLLAGCTAFSPLRPPPAPALSVADLRAAEHHAYLAGYAAGRHFQQQQDAQSTAEPADLSAPEPPPPNPPLRPVPPPIDGYSASGPAQPLATR